jgi:hypothetical protein
MFLPDFVIPEKFLELYTSDLYQIRKKHSKPNLLSAGTYVVRTCVPELYNEHENPRALSEHLQLPCRLHLSAIKLMKLVT